MSRLLRTNTELCRACFVPWAVSEGVYAALHRGLATVDQLCRQLSDAGFADVRKKRLTPLESFRQFVGTKPKA